MKRATAVSVIVLVAVLSFVLGFWFSGFMAVDACLDNGGRWTEGVDVCDLP